MNLVQRIASIVLTLALAAAVGAGAWWLLTNKPESKSADKHPPAADVSKVIKEEMLNTVRLSEQAEARIGLVVEPVRKAAARQQRVYGGEVTIPVGRAIPVAAPLGGILKAPSGGDWTAGRTVKAGEVVFELTPLLTPDARANLSAALVDAEGQVNAAKAQAELAHIAFDRAKRVLEEGAGSQRQVDEAEAANTVAARTLDATTARYSVLKKVVGDAELGTAAPIPLTAPQDGILRLVSARPSQTVPGGAALFEVVDLSVVWVRVPLPVGDLDDVVRGEPALVGKLSAPSGTRHTTANPVPAPPSADPLAATVDLFYELPNPDQTLVPGERVGVAVPLAGQLESRIVPWSAVVYDIYGGTWVFERTGPHTYTRRRVLVSHTVGTDAVLADADPNAPATDTPVGPPVGAQVVTAGVQQLFAAETGFIK